jgi:biliverdin reductase
LLKIGIIGTGYAAKLRAEALQTEPRAQLVAVAGNSPERTQAFAGTYNATAHTSWQSLLDRDDVDLVIIATVNRLHGTIAQSALKAGKHVIVEYPLAVDVAEAEAAISLGKSTNKLLHVEHIELLGGVHQAFKTAVPQIGTPFFAKYSTLKPERPAPDRWTYDSAQFGFPLVGALSRLHRLIDVFGKVDSVTCQAQFWPNPAVNNLSAFSTCLCTVHLRFSSGLLAEVTYGKGESLWQSDRRCEVQGALGALVFEGDRGTLLNSTGETPIEVGGRRGLFAIDTAMVLDHLLDNSPLYITPEASLYTLKVADAARRSAEIGRAISIG